ncbi:MAG: 50S ribosomal protein L29 [Candidatus Woesearchaeota archaeon]
MKKKDYNNLSVQEISKKLSDLNSELIKVKGQAATGSTQKNTMQIRQIKRLMARLITLKSQKENQTR